MVQIVLVFGHGRWYLTMLSRFPDKIGNVVLDAVVVSLTFSIDNDNYHIRVAGSCYVGT